MQKKPVVAILAVLALLLASGCAKTYEIETPIGNFEMASETADSFKDYFPEPGNSFLLIYLHPLDSDITIDHLASYLKPADDKRGPTVVINDVEYDLKYLAYGDNNPPTCVLIYEIPGVKVTPEQVNLRLPSA